MKYETNTQFLMPDADVEYSVKDLGIQWKRGVTTWKAVTPSGSVAVFGILPDGQMQLIDAGEVVVEWVVSDRRFDDYAIQAKAGATVTLFGRSYGQGQVQDPVPSTVIVDEYEDESIEAKVLKALRKYIPQEETVQKAFSDLGDVFDDDENWGPDGDDDTDLDLLFLEKGPAAVIERMEQLARADVPPAPPEAPQKPQEEPQPPEAT